MSGLAGTLSERVTVLRQGGERDASGGVAGDWAEVARMWAAARPGRSIATGDGAVRRALRKGMALWVSEAACWAVRGVTGWTLGTLSATALTIGGQVVVGARQPAIDDPVGGETVDAQARAALAEILGTLRNHGLIGH